MSQPHRAEQAQSPHMSDRRAHRTVVPTDLPPSGAPTDAAPRRPGCAPNDSFIVFAYATLARELAALRKSRPPLERAATPDEIHQLRVAARRLRVALRLFRRMLSSRAVARLIADLRWFATALGDVRDLDVYTDNFKQYCLYLTPEQRNELSGYELYLRRERADARQRATAALADPRARAMFDEAASFVARGPSAAALRRWRSLTARNGMRASIRRSTARVRRLGLRLDARSRPAALHELRIKAKRLRYELEFFAEVYPALKQPADACKALQDLLGTHQDACTATARLRRYAALLKKQGAASALPAALVQLRRSQLALARSVRASFVDQWPGFVAVIDVARRLVA
jgi:CHAD domain-containing protein